MDFNVEYEASCGYDDLSVYDGNSAKAALLRRVCGDSLPKPVVSQSNVVFVQFLTDDDEGHDGFKARITFEDPPGISGYIIEILSFSFWAGFKFMDIKKNIIHRYYI